MGYRANLKRLRKARGMSQQALADACGWEYQSRVSNYEIPLERSGARTPDMDDALVLARALNVSIQEIYGERSQPMKLDPETMASALKITEAMEYGRPKDDFRTWAETLVFVYSRVAAGGQAEVVDQYLDAAKERLEPKGETNERDDPRDPRKR